MSGREILHKIKVKAGFGSSSEKERGKTKLSKNITYGFHAVKGKSNHAMEDFVVSKLEQKDGHELGLFAVFDGHLGYYVAEYLKRNLFYNILVEDDFWSDMEGATRKAYQRTDDKILENHMVVGKGGSTAVTAIIVDGRKLVVANVGDSRAVLCRSGSAEQLSVDHDPITERKQIERRGGFVSTIPGDVPRVDGQLAVARVFGDRSLKAHLSSEPDVVQRTVDGETEFLILASDGVWKVMSNEEAVSAIRDVKNAREAAKQLIEEALLRKSKDDIFCVVVRF